MEFHRDLLSKAQKKLYDDCILPWFREGITDTSDSRTFKLPRGLEVNEVGAVTEAILNDHPEIVSLKHVKSYRTIFESAESDAEGNLTITYRDPLYHHSYAYTEEKRRELTEQISEWLDEVADMASGYPGEIDKVRFLMGHFAANYEFQENATAHTVEGLITGYIVCEGVARGFKMACDRLGIWCIVVSGYAGPKKGDREGHAWNMVRIGKKYYHVDATWNLTQCMTGIGGVVPGGPSKLLPYSYLMLSDEQIRDTHKPFVEGYPECSDGSLEYYSANGLILRFNTIFTRCETPAEDIPHMVRAVKYPYGTAYLLRVRLVNDRGEHPPQTDALNRITTSIISDLLGLTMRDRRLMSYDEDSGNYMILFTRTPALSRPGDRKE